MNFTQNKYTFIVERINRGRWVPLMQTDLEDTHTFELIANAEEYQYRILRDGEDVTKNYKNNAHYGGFQHE